MATQGRVQLSVCSSQVFKVTGTQSLDPRWSSLLGQFGPQGALAVCEDI